MHQLIVRDGLESALGTLYELHGTLVLGLCRHKSSLPPPSIRSTFSFCALPGRLKEWMDIFIS
jgi:hypothetical protein